MNSELEKLIERARTGNLIGDEPNVHAWLSWMRTELLLWRVSTIVLAFLWIAALG